MTSVELLNRIRGAIFGAAIGDALGGPVEGKTYREIEEEHGRVESFLPYRAEPWPFYAWRRAPGTITDDTRMRHIFIQAVFENGNTLNSKGLKQSILERWRRAHTKMEKDWLEEYALSAQRDRLYCGGYPGNGGLISSLPAALLHPGDPKTAFRTAFEAIYFNQGYARDCTATHCAIAAIALNSHERLDRIIEKGVSASPLDLVHSRYFPRPLLEQLAKVKTIVAQHRHFDEYKDQFYAALTWPYMHDAMETFCLAMGIIMAEPTKPLTTVLNAVNLGRDNDSTATIVGGLMGARYGLKAWPEKWIATVERANPEIDFWGDAERVAELVYRRRKRSN